MGSPPPFRASCCLGKGPPDPLIIPVPSAVTSERRLGSQRYRLLMLPHPARWCPGKREPRTKVLSPNPRASPPTTFHLAWHAPRSCDAGQAGASGRSRIAYCVPGTQPHSSEDPGAPDLYIRGAGFPLEGLKTGLRETWRWEDYGVILALSR